MDSLTPAQQTAVMCDASEILVSAAAGSGKTSVLTERILRHVADGIGIDRLLVVTFTEAASAEMRERITTGLLADRRLAHQAALLPTADISTIHAFCLKLVRENFQAVDLDPAFRVGDEAELSVIKSQVIDELFEAEYAEGSEAFLDLADVYGGKTLDGRLDTLVRSVHNFMESDPFPMEAAKRYAAFFDLGFSDLDKTLWADVAREELLIGLEGALDGLCRSLEICGLPGGPYKYAARLQEEREFVKKLLETVKNGKFAEMYMAFKSIEWGRLPAISAKEDITPELKSRVRRIRDIAVKRRIRDLTKGVFFAPPEKMLSDLAALRPRVAALMNLASRFSEAYSAEKRERNLLDFSDLEHFAIRILYPKGPEDMTPAGTRKYYEVLVDEYQDSNMVQELILSAVGERMFYVGDVKQSIYRFRRAEPELFREKMRSETCTRIDLSSNFRSRPEVLDAVNFIFSQLMCEKVGGVDYGGAELIPGREEYQQPTIPAETWVELLDQNSDGDEQDDDETISNVVAETRLIAGRVNELLSAGKCRPGDIAIITRSLSGIAGEVIEELKNNGIDAAADIAEGFFDQQEVLTALAFLRVTDNPRQDIELITVLNSPVYAFSPDELFEISRRGAEKSDFYDRLAATAAGEPSPLAEKAGKFLNDLEKWRTAAVYLPVSRLIGLIYDSTKYPAFAAGMPGGAVRRANLRLLLERAIEFEETSLRGLFHFIQYIERQRETGAAAASSPTSGKVRLMTIHKSKGLEFPVVICAFLAKRFNIDDERQPVVLHSARGVGPYYVDTALRTRSNTLARFSLARLTRRENLSEELRCLYVAMTRAKEMLILTGRSKNLQKSMEKWSDVLDAGPGQNLLPLYYRRNASSYLDWIMPCVLRETSGNKTSGALPPNPNELFEKSLIKTIGNARIRISVTRGSEERVSPAGYGTKPDDFETESFILQPFERIPALPSKLSISEIRRLYDITPDSAFREEISPVFEPPAFIKAESGITPARMGSALHTVVEHIDYHRHTSRADVQSLLSELAAKNLLTGEEAAALDPSKIERLTNSPLAERIRKAEKVYRETPFVLALPASLLYPDLENLRETILVHGIIDCHFRENDGIVLIDFKSDYIPADTSLEKWAAAHRVQLNIYKQAITKATGIEVKEVLLYSFARGTAVSVPI